MNMLVSRLIAVVSLIGLLQPCASAMKGGDRPTMPQLKHFPARKGYLKIHEEIGTKCNDFGTIILDDKTGAKTRSISKANGPNPEEINSAILHKWLTGEGLQPVTWNTLLRCLRVISLHTLADDIATGLSDESSNYSTHFDGRSVPTHILPSGEVCTTVKTRKELHQTLATVGQWFDLCSNLAVSESKLNSLNHSEKQEDTKKRECLDAFFDLGEGEACWERVVRVVSGYPIDNRGLAKRIAQKYNINFEKVVLKDEL